MIRSRPARSLAAVLFTAALLTGCGSDDATGPLRAVTGHYLSTRWLVTSAGTTTDLVAAGGQVHLYLDGAGGALGRVIVPAGVAGASAVDLYFDGPYEVANGVVRIRSEEDVFVRDMPLTIEDASLVGDETFIGTRVQVTLTRQPFR